MNFKKLLSRWIRRGLLWMLNLMQPEETKQYIYVHDLDDRYKLFYLGTFEHLPAAIRSRMLK